MRLPTPVVLGTCTSILIIILKELVWDFKITCFLLNGYYSFWLDYSPLTQLIIYIIRVDLFLKVYLCKSYQNVVKILF